jgi:hypothetical protein
MTTTDEMFEILNTNYLRIIYIHITKKMDGN